MKLKKIKINNSKLLLIMIFIDVFVKIIIDNFFMEDKLFINDKLGFLPYLNTEQLSIFNNELELGVSLNFLIVINLIGGIALVFVRNMLKREKEWNTVLDIATLMIFAGVVCSLVDKIFWKGSLDYILFFSKIVDLKDIYMFEGFFIYIIDICRQFVGKVIKNRT